MLLFSCDPEEDPGEVEYGYLSMSVTLTITSEEANGRIDAVNTDDFRVTIFDAGGTEVMVFDPYSSAPSEVSLPTGEYYVEAHSNNLVDAAFDNPYYFGRSANFTIDKEETTTIDIEPELANTKVAILYSENVENNFDTYTGTVEVIATGATLFYAQGETREGYFVTSPLEIVVNLSYTKLDGTTIDKSFTTTIDDPQPKTLYNINVDATLEDGVIAFNITVDETFEVIDIILGATSTDSCLYSGYFMEVLGESDQSSPTWTRGADGLIHVINYFEDGENFIMNLTYDAQDQMTRIESLYTRADLFYDGLGRLIREEAYDYDFDLAQWMPDGNTDYVYNVHGQLYRELDDGGGYKEYIYPNTTTNNPSERQSVQAAGYVSQVISYTYDANPNPFQEQGMRFWDIIDTDQPLFSDNNITYIRDQEYDSDGIPTYFFAADVIYTYDEI